MEVLIQPPVTGGIQTWCQACPCLPIPNEVLPSPRLRAIAMTREMCNGELRKSFPRSHSPAATVILMKNHHLQSRPTIAPSVLFNRMGETSPEAGSDVPSIRYCRHERRSSHRKEPNLFINIHIWNHNRYPREKIRERLQECRILRPT